MIDESKLFLTEEDCFSTEDFFATEEETNMLYEQYLCEWKVDPEKKKKLVDKAVTAFQKACNSSGNDAVKQGVKLYKPALIDKANLTWFQKIRGKHYDETKMRKLLVGHYSFNVKKMVDSITSKDDSPYKTLKNIMRDLNGDFSELTFRIGTSTENEVVKEILSYIPIPGLNQVIGIIASAALRQKAGTIWVDLEKKSIKREGVDFASSVMNDLFNE